MTRWNVRCSKEKCKLRYVFQKHPDDYKVPRKCDGCDGTKYRVIKDMHAERGRHELCTCAGYHKWGDDDTASRPPHRMGSPACWYTTTGEMRPQEYFEPAEDENAATVVSELEPEPATGHVWGTAMQGTTSEIASWQTLCAAEVLAEEVDHAAYHRDSAVG